MNEVEKMYKTIFGEFAPNCSLCIKLIGCKIFNNTHNCNKFECNYQRFFTAEKQLELVRWLIQKNITDYRIINYFEDSYYCLYAWEDGFKESELFKSYEEALACLFNYLWQDLTDAEKAQIKNILESEVRE